METKKCSKCGEIKEFEKFNKNKKGKYGLRSDCKSCESDRNKKNRIKNPEKNKEKCKIYKIKNATKEKERLNKASYHSIVDLDCRYIKKILKESGFTTDQINENPELIEVKKLIIKTKRLCKTLQTLEKV